MRDLNVVSKLIEIYIVSIDIVVSDIDDVAWDFVELIKEIIMLRNFYQIDVVHSVTVAVAIMVNN